jgi:hypothetical protein
MVTLYDTIKFIFFQVLRQVFLVISAKNYPGFVGEILEMFLTMTEMCAKMRHQFMDFA